jgi:hypothetical protein
VEGRPREAWVDQFRVDLVGRVEEARNEEQVADILHGIASAVDDHLGPLREDFEQSPDEAAAAEILAVAETWASIASYVVTEFYVEGPRAVGSPLLRRAGMGKVVSAALIGVVRRLRPHVQRAYARTGASSYSIGLNFPWGIQLSLTWE